jgi:hypothetical protein
LAGQRGRVDAPPGGRGRTPVREESRTLRYAVASWIELLLLLPVWLAIDAWIIPASMRGYWIAALPVLALFGALAGQRWMVLWKQLGVSVATGAAAAYLLPGAGVSLLGIAAFAAAGFAVFLGLTVSGRISEPKWLWGGLAIYFIAAFLFPRISLLEGTVPLMTAAGLLCLAIALFATNRRFLRDATLANNRSAAVPAIMRNHNGMFIGSILVAAIVLTALFGNAFGGMLFALLRWLLHLLLSAEPTEVPEELPPAPPPANPGFQEAEGESGLLGLILEIVGYVVGGVILLGLTAAVLYWLYKNFGGIVRVWVRRLLTFMRRSGRKAENDGYTDEETVVFSWEAVGRRMQESWLGRLVARSRTERWDDQATNRDRVRYLYRIWLRAAVDGGYEPKRQLTPKETASDIAEWSDAAAKVQASKRVGGESAGALLGLYYRARYGESDATDDEIEAVRRKLEPK